MPANKEPKATLPEKEKEAPVVAKKEEAQVVAAVEGFTVTVTPAGIFYLRTSGDPIFSSGGTVHVGGRPQEVLEWGATYIRGRFDADVKEGEVIVQIDDKTRFVGYLKL